MVNKNSISHRADGIDVLDGRQAPNNMKNMKNGAGPSGS
jgi:hypothetical protein